MGSIWSMWVDLLQATLDFLSSEVGLGLGLAIVVMTLLLRVLLLPVSWSAAYGSFVHQKKIKQLQPQLKALKERYAKQPEVYTREMLALHKAHGVSMVNGKSMLGTFAQLPVFIAMFHVLRGTGKGVRFLWVSNLIKPNVLLALVVGVSAALIVVMNPDMPQHTRMLMMAISSVIALLSALHFGSALALYWTTSNLFSALQTWAIHRTIDRRVRQGTLRI